MKENEVLDAIRHRRSVRTYTTDPIREEELSLILEAATYAPSGMNKYTYHLTAVTNPEKLRELNLRIRQAFLNSNDERLRLRGLDEDYVCYYYAPALIIVSNDPADYWAGQDCACALQNIFLAAHSLHIGSCWINQLSHTVCDDPGVRELLTEWGVPENHRVFGCASLGYPIGEEREPPMRKPGLVSRVQ